MKEVGILDTEIYIHKNRLFMIMDTVADFDHNKAMKKLAPKPRQSVWESFVSRFRVTSKDATANDLEIDLSGMKNISKNVTDQMEFVVGVVSSQGWRKSSDPCVGIR